VSKFPDDSNLQIFEIYPLYYYFLTSTPSTQIRRKISPTTIIEKNQQIPTNTSFSRKEEEMHGDSTVLFNEIFTKLILRKNRPSVEYLCTAVCT